MSKVKILRVRMKEAAPLGTAAVVEKHVGFDSRIDNADVELSFDKDTRFVRVTLLGNKKKQFELIPITNVATMLCETVD